LPSSGWRLASRSSTALFSSPSFRSRCLRSVVTSLRSWPRSAFVPETPTVGVVVLTQGTRPADLERGIQSILAQEGVTTDVVCVGNGWDPTGLPASVKTLGLPRNLGIPAGRNR